MRSFALPKGVDPSQISAAFADGVLELTVPKPPVKEPVKTKIQIK
jgi:HSP20 family molecular chaperone IbpA